MLVALGDLVVIMLALKTEVSVLKPGRGWWMFKGDKNPYHNFLRRGIKVYGKSHNFYGMLQIYVEYGRDTSPPKITDISRGVSLFATRCICLYLPEGSGRWIRNDQTSNLVEQQIVKWQQCMGRFVRYHPVTVTGKQYLLIVKVGGGL
jgi:hypothetical protein